MSHTPQTTQRLSDVALQTASNTLGGSIGQELELLAFPNPAPEAGGEIASSIFRWIKAVKASASKDQPATYLFDKLRVEIGYMAKPGKHLIAFNVMNVNDLGNHFVACARLIQPLLVLAGEHRKLDASAYDKLADELAGFRAVATTYEGDCRGEALLALLDAVADLRDLERVNVQS
ncbi:hypothetical protein [Devosia sp.]|uniref:hypothetical protein n=1 Tax=Devosia sp. TaxID=1871048 RepID=UPI003F707813